MNSQQLLQLSNSQTLLLAGQQLQPQDPLYNMAFSFQLAGAIDPQAFSAAFDELVARCDALRLVLVEDPDGVAQQDLGSAAGDYLFQDLSGAENPEQRLACWLDEHRGRHLDPFGCQFESALLKLGEEQFVWFFNQHHLFTDAWSVSLLFDRLAQLYQRQCGGGNSEIAPLPGAAEMAAAGQQQDALYQRSLTYWRDGPQQPARVGRFYREPPREVGGRTRRYPCPLGSRRSRQLQELISRPGFASFSREMSCMQVFATALYAYLHRISGNELLAVGTPSHSRATPQLRETAGLLINIFPLYVKVDAAASFAELYAQVARANQELLMHASAELAGVTDPRAFDVLLNYIPSSFGSFAGLPVTTDWVHPGYGDSGHLLRLQVHDFDRSGEFTLLFDLNEQAFSPQEAQWVQAHYLALLDALLTDPDQLLGAPPLSDITGQLALLEGGDSWPARCAVEHTVVDLLAARFRDQPERTALICNGERWRYGELDQRSASLAAHLREGGAGPGEVVAMLLPRGTDLVAAAIAVLRCGATLLPLDPAYPLERNEYMLRDAGARLLISRLDIQGSEILSPGASIFLDRDWPLISATVSSGLSPPHCEDGAYIIYTSGSTGRPKGVLVGHRALSNYIGWAGAHYLQGEALDFPLFTPVCFDLTVTSLFTPLTCGGALVVYPEPQDSAEITVRRVIEDNAVDVIKLTPAHLALIGNMDLSRSRLRCLIVGGEDFKTDLARTIADYLGAGVAIYNEYGPTEATVGCTLHRFDAELDTGSSVPIGRPISNTRIYVLDGHLNPVPLGVTGELYIAGTGLAEGYLNHAGLTAEKFVADPFVSGNRMYRSGDRARWSHQGYLEYLGRADHQVKIRGVRIETAEIEAALLRYESVSAAVVDAVLPPQQLPEDDERRCHRCGIENRHPAAQLDDTQLCRICRVYEQNRAQAQAYFRNLEDLQHRIADIRARASGQPDSIMLLSGGKDSSYALCRLVDLGLNPLVFTLDNGYISDGAMANIRRLVDRLGLELVVGSTPIMDSIFVESLTRHSNVCNGCFKTIYTLSMQLARERGISTICTGLSRGQIFETRVAHLFQQGIYDPAQIDRQIIEARKAYHRVDDVIARNMDVSMFQQDAVFEDIDFLDFYRYTEVSLNEVYEYLHTRVPWIRPTDTGRSTNCLINDAGIYVHKLERGYHNYALPYSWDVRLGHKQRGAAVHELEDEIDDDKVQRILGDLGYVPRKAAALTAADRHLVAWYVAGEEIAVQNLREALAQQLPPEFIPRQFIRLAELPLTSNGKVDRDALPRPQLTRQELAGAYAPPRTDAEHTLAALWQRMLALDEVGIDDNFFELGGDSIVNVQIVAAAREAGVAITAQQLFDHPTVRELAAVAGACTAAQVDQAPVVGEVTMLPALQRYFAAAPELPQQFCQAVVLDCAQAIDPVVLRDALHELLTHHDVLRSRFHQGATGWRQQLLPPGGVVPVLTLVDTAGADREQRETMIDIELARMAARMDLEQGSLLQASYLQGAEAADATLLLAINHLVVDGVSWWLLLEDLEQACAQLAEGRPVTLPAKTVSVGDWGRHLAGLRHDQDSIDRAAFWRGQAGAGGIPHDPARLADNTADSVRRIRRHLDRDITLRLAREVPAVAGVQVQDLLLTALTQVLLQWSGNDSLAVELEGYGREDPQGAMEPLRTVGWFTSFYPLALRLADGGGQGEDIRAVRQQLQAIPCGGVEYGIHHGGDGAAAAPMLFNYLGQWDLRLSGESPFSFARPISVYGAEHGQRRHLLELSAVIFDSQLQLAWQFSPKLHRQEDIERLATDYCRRLEQLIDYCIDSGDSALTPADFPAAGIDQDELDSLLEEFGDLP